MPNCRHGEEQYYITVHETHMQCAARPTASAHLYSTGSDLTATPFKTNRKIKMPVWPQYNYVTLVNSDAVPFRSFGGVRSDVKILFSGNSNNFPLRLPVALDVRCVSLRAKGNFFHGNINCWFVRCITMRAECGIRTNRNGFAVWILRFGRF